MSNSKKHHYVPQFYLKQWCNDGDKIIRYFKNKPLIRPAEVSIKGECMENNLNTSRCGDKSVETDFCGNIDGNASQALKNFLILKDGDVINNEDKVKFTPFLNTLHGRQPKFMNSIRTFNEINRISGMKLAEKHLKETGIDNREYYRKQKYDDSPKVFALNSTIGGGTVMSRSYEKDLNKVMKSRWEIKHIDFYFNFLTSDSPLIIEAYTEEYIIDELPELFAYTFILSPEKLLLISNINEIFDRYKKITQDFVKKINELIMKNANKVIFAESYKSKRFISKFIQNC